MSRMKTLGQWRFAAATTVMWMALAGCNVDVVVAAMDATVMASPDAPIATADVGRDAAADAVDASVPPMDFACPEGWVASAHGGCGPAVLLCAPDGGAAVGACVGHDPTSPVSVRDPDGVEGTRFYRLPDGGIGGGWSTPWVCPAGWTNAPEGFCRPTLRDDCPRFSGPLPDGTCTPTDESRCPAGGYAEVPPEAAGQRVVYVRQMATLTPDGSMRAPYPDLNQAVAAEPDAEWFLLYPGSYPVGFTVRHATHIVGGCAASVQLTGTATYPLAAGMPLFRLDGPAMRLDLRGVSLSSGTYNVFAEHGAVATIRACILSGARYNAIEVNHGATVEAVDSLFADLDAISMGHHGIAGGGGTLVLRRSTFPGTSYISVIAEYEGASALVEDVALRGTRSATIRSSDGATLTVRRASIRGQTPTPVMIARNAHAEIEDLSVRDTSFVGSDSINGGVGVRDGSSLVARRISIENITGSGLLLHGAEVTASVDQIFVRSVRGFTGSFGGSGIIVEQLGTLSLRRAQIIDTADIGFNVSLFGTADVRDTLIRRVVPQGNGLYGIGLGVNLLGSVDARRVVIEEASMVGIAAIGLPERVTRLVDLSAAAGRPVDPRVQLALEDVIVRDARPVERYPAAGIMTGVAGIITGRRVSVDQQPGIGIAVADFGYNTDDALAGGVRSGLLRAEQVPALRVLLGPVLDGPSTATLDGVFVRGPRRWRVGYEPATPDRPLDTFGAYGVYTGPRCAFTGTDVTLDGAPAAEIGVASLGVTTLRRGVITGHSGCAASLSNTTGAAAITLDAFTLSGNGRDAVCADDALPAVRLPLSPN